ncbi:MAG: hypothetical protein DI586_04305 [Micavibrio aeruginosavorus]|uniref:Uncharacterized protein n=1 Tax=Micavibrio aeruginosavorus TaxID=349221 RepID=A0A2W5FR13_9BACT|nr:MAG: hypothetical protein DI586_04305 [Micavibrio aeruginosavorus]
MNNHIKLSISETVKAMEADGAMDHQLSLLKGLRDVGGRLLCVPRLCTVRLGDATSGTPTLVQIGDDDDTPTGVAGWNKDVLVSILSRANFIAVHACAADDFYTFLPFMTFMASKGALIECTPEYFKEWVEFAQLHAPNAQFLGCYPRDLEFPQFECGLGFEHVRT